MPLRAAPRICIGLMRAVQTWDPDKGPLSLHAFWRMRGALSRYRQRGKRCLPTVPWLSLSEPVDGDEGLPLVETLCDLEAVPADDMALAGELVDILGTLKAQHQEVIFRRAVGDTLEEIGTDMGRTRERVRQIEATAVQRTRRKAC